jgi:hypothetical protein
VERQYREGDAHNMALPACAAAWTPPRPSPPPRPARLAAPPPRPPRPSRRPRPRLRPSPPPSSQRGAARAWGPPGVRKGCFAVHVRCAASMRLAANDPGPTRLSTHVRCKGRARLCMRVCRAMTRPCRPTQPDPPPSQQRLPRCRLEGLPGRAAGAGLQVGIEHSASHPRHR